MDAFCHQHKIFNKSIFFVVVIFSVVSCSKTSPPSVADQQNQVVNGVFFLVQGWDTTTRQKLSHISFGSRMLDYDWFMALEQADSEHLFRDDEHLLKLGFIADPANPFNPDELPVGISRDNDRHGKSWMGLTCSACHVGQIKINDQPVRIEGGQSLINYTQLELEMVAALKATLADTEKLQRFFKRLQRTQKNISIDDIKKSLEQKVLELDAHNAMNLTDVPYGHGRLDAFGQIFNAIAVEALKIPANKHMPDAPTSFPVLWDASHLNIVQWNASAPNNAVGPLFQNATTAMAVYGKVNVDHRVTYSSSTDIQNLGYIQAQFYKLTAPKWPENLAGEIDKNAQEHGKILYQKFCIACHTHVDSTDPKRTLNAVLVAVDNVGTDPRMAANFAQARVKTGSLEGKRKAIFFGDKFGAEASAIDVVMHVTAGTLARHPLDTTTAVVEEYANNNPAPASKNRMVYKARPINGIWASAPYLHNGSVPTVYDLLLPAAARPKQFYVGNRELDVKKIGNHIAQVDGSSLFDTSLPGNANTGHEYGTQLSEPERMALLEYIKTL